MTLYALAATALISYAIACWLWPFTNCWRCKGSGKRRSPTGKRFGKCRWCKGSRMRLRLGRHAWNALAKTHEKGTKPRRSS
jgi:hypothetical protein